MAQGIKAVVDIRQSKREASCLISITWLNMTKLFYWHHNREGALVAGNRCCSGNRTKLRF